MSREKFIPHELIIDILWRLPSESLLRFKSVCKSWYALISLDPDFRTRRLHNNPNLAHWLCVKSSSYQVFDKNFSSEGSLSLPCPVPKAYPTIGAIRWLPEDVIGSCNGLICVYHSRCDTGIQIYKNDYSTEFTFGLWNPTTRTHKTLEVLSIPNLRSDDPFFGVGFSNKDGDYKVVVVAKGHWRLYDQQVVYDHEVHNHVFLYSLRDNSWSELQDVLDSSWQDWYTLYELYGGSGTYYNGAFHWACSVQRKPKILCFDFDDKSFRLMDSPKSLDDGRYRNTFVHKDKLVCWERSSSEYGFWVMEEYGNSNSWVSLFRVDNEKLPCLKPQSAIFGTTNDGKLLLHKPYIDASYCLKAYDPETKESKELQATNVTLVPYQENLMIL